MKRLFSLLCFATLPVIGREPCHFNRYYSSPNHIFLTAEVLQFDLSTKIKSVKTQGNKTFYGVRIGYERLKPRGFYGAFEYLGAFASGAFKSSQNNVHIALRDQDDAFFGDLELRGGYTFSPANWLITPIIGMNVYATAPQEKNHDGYQEFFTCWAFGFRTKYELSSCLDSGLNLKLLRTVHGERKFKSKDIYHKEYRNCLGVEVGLPLTWIPGCSQRWEFQVEPYFIKLDFSRKTDVFGGRMRFGFLF